MNENIKKYLLIYHKEDNDGVFSAAIMYDYLINTMNIDKDIIDLLPADYVILNDFANKCEIEYLKDTYKMIIMTDISFNNWKYMKKIYKEFNNDFIWCDHHAPIIKCSVDNNFDSIPGIRDTGRSAILCVWKYLYDTFDEEYNKKKKLSNIPELLRILSAWDSFTYEKNGYKLDYVYNVNAGVTAKLNLNFDNAYNLIKDIKDNNSITNHKKLIKSFEITGKIVNDFQLNQMKNIIMNNGDFTFKLSYQNNGMDNKTITRKCCAIFVQGPTNSLMFECVKDISSDIKNGIVFKRNNSGNWVMSLYNIYNDDTFHCGNFCKEHYNGGGHVGAAGCTLTEKQFIKILKDKSI